MYKLYKQLRHFPLTVKPSLGIFFCALKNLLHLGQVKDGVIHTKIKKLVTRLSSLYITDEVVHSKCSVFFFYVSNEYRGDSIVHLDTFNNHSISRCPNHRCRLQGGLGTVQFHDGHTGVCRFVTTHWQRQKLPKHNWRRPTMLFGVHG